MGFVFIKRKNKFLVSYNIVCNITCSGVYCFLVVFLEGGNGTWFRNVGGLVPIFHFKEPIKARLKLQLMVEGLGLSLRSFCKRPL